MKWRSILAILVMVVGLSARARAEVVLDTDDNVAVFSGSWTRSTSGVGFYGTDFAFAHGGTTATAKFMNQIPTTSTATWCIQARWTDGSSRTTAAQYQVFDGASLRGTFKVNQQVNGGAWRQVGCVKLTAGRTSVVQISNAGVSSSSIVVADAVRWVWDERPLLQDFCVAVSGGFGSGGESFVGKEFIPPTNGTCKPWAGIVKAAASVVANSSGAACLSDDGKVLTITLLSTDPEFFGPVVGVTDHIVLCLVSSGCPVSQSDNSTYSGFGGPAAQQTCTTALTSIPSSHN